MNVFKSGKTKTNIVCLFVTLTSFALMALYAGSASLWSDDLFTLGVTLESFPRAFEIMVIDAHSHPPLHLIISYIWMRIIPYGTFWIKLSSMLYVSFGIYLCAQNAKKMNGDRTAIITSLLAGTSFFLIREAAFCFRPYGLLFLLINAFIWFYIKRLDNIGKERMIDVVSYGVVMLLLMYTHYFGCLIAAVFFFGDVYLFVQKKIRWQCVFAYIIAGVFFLPWFLVAAKAIIGRGGVFWASVPTLETLQNTLFVLLGSSKILFVIFVITVVLFLMKDTLLRSKTNLAERNKYLVILLSFAFLSIILFVYVISRYIHTDGSFFVLRYFVSIIPMGVIVTSIGIEFILDLILDNHAEENKKLCFTVLFLLIFFYMGENAFFEIKKAPYAINEPYEQAIEWIYSKDDSHADDSTMLIGYTRDSDGIRYYVTHNGSRPEINYLNGISSEIDVDLWKKIYRFDGHFRLSQGKLDILDQYYDLVEENKELRIQVYKRKE